MRKFRRRGLWAWILILGFFAVFVWLCKDRFHMVYPGYYIVLSLAASTMLILAMWRTYVGSMVRGESDSETVRPAEAKR